MENQHRQIKGYRELTPEEIALMNEIKAKGPELEQLLARVAAHVEQQRLHAHDHNATDEAERLLLADPERWAETARIHLQEGLMALTRAVAQPTFF